MKKILLTAAVILAAATTANAQVEDFSRAGHLATEVQFNPFSDNFETFKMGELKFRYFINDDNALRISIGYGLDKKENTNIDNFNSKFDNFTKNYTISTTETREESTSQALKAAIGYEYHIDLLDRLSVYLGGEVGYEGKFFKGKKTIDTQSESKSYNTIDNPPVWNPATMQYVTSNYNAEGNSTFTKNEVYDYKKQTPDGANRNQNALIANIFTGIDFQLYRGLYIGTELGIGFKYGKNINSTYTYNMTSKGVSTMTYSGTIPQVTTGYDTLGNPIQEPTKRNETVTTDSYVKFDSETGIRESMTTTKSSIADNNTDQPTEPTKTANNFYDNSTKFTNISLYIQPALRLGWRF